MKLAVITTLNKKLLDNYGFKFFNSYNWPFDLFIYSEDLKSSPKKDSKLINIFEKVPECKNFVGRNSSRIIKDAIDAYIFDGVRFSYKVYAFTDFILNNSEYEGLIFIDADSIIYKKINERWVLKKLYKNDHMITYLGRGSQYTETGFLFFNLKHKLIKNFANDFQNMYNSDRLYELEFQHDGWVFDHVRLKYEKQYKVKNFNIGDNKPGHVQARTFLLQIFDHLKGPKRKRSFLSPERNKIKFLLTRIIDGLLRRLKNFKRIFLNF